jgi:D-alanyl-D-alanine carboxypeptidase
MSSRSWRVAATAIAFAIGIAAGGVAGLAAHGSPHRSIRHSVALPLGPIRAPRSTPVVPGTMLAWTFHPLPAGFADRVGHLGGVAHAVPVVSGTAWLTRSFTADGTVVDHPPAGLGIPLEVAAADLHRYAPFLTPAERAFLPDLARGEALLGATSAKLRRLAAGAMLRFGTTDLRVAGVVPDAEIGAHEVFVSLRTAARLGVSSPRYLLIDPKRRVSQGRLSARIRALLPPDEPLRIRGPGETTFLRQGDAVLPPVILKELFGEFAARPAPGGFLQVDPRWEATHIVTASVPILGRVRCNRGIVPQLRGALSEVVSDGLSQLIDPSQYGGCYVPKFLLNDPHAGISHHSWGIAIDLNVGQNPFGHTPHQDPRLVQIFEKWGFIWGGRFLVPDGMHFEFVRFSSG